MTNVDKMLVMTHHHFTSTKNVFATATDPIWLLLCVTNGPRISDYMLLIIPDNKRFKKIDSKVFFQSGPVVSETPFY